MFATICRTTLLLTILLFGRIFAADRPDLQSEVAHAKIAVMETAFGKRGDVNSIQDAKQAGYLAIQMHSGMPQEIQKKPIDSSLGLAIGKDPSIVKAWKKASDELDVEIISLCAGSLNRCEIWDRDREVAMRIAKQTIDACHTLDVKTMLFPFFGPSNFQDSDAALTGVADFMKELLPYATARDVVIGIEAPVTTVRVLELLQMLNYPQYMKIYYDTGNLFAKEDIYATVRKYARPHFCEIHIKPYGHAVFGMDEIDVVKLAKALDDADYDQWLVYEAGRGGRDPVGNRKGIEQLVALRSQAKKESSFCGNWALRMPDGAAGWLTLSATNGEALTGELWTVGGGKQLSEVSLDRETLSFVRNIRVGQPNYEGGPPTGKRIPSRHFATLSGDVIRIEMERPLDDGTIDKLNFIGKRMPPVPPEPDLSKVKFGDPIELFNGRNLDGWKLTNPKQINGWKAIDGELVNTTPKLDFQPYSRYGNLRTEREFMDFNLKVEFKVPPGGNSGIYLRGIYEAQVVDRDSRMQGIQGVGAIFGRIAPIANVGKPGNEWQRYDITIVDRHATVILNGKKVIDNQPIGGCTNGALHADETIPGPLYLQGDHTAVSYRNIVLCPVVN